MENLLTEKQALIDAKESDLAELKEKLEKVETGLATPEESIPLDSISEDTNEDAIAVLKSQIEEAGKARDEAIEKLKEAQALLEEEKVTLLKQQEEAEEILRDNMEKLREKLEAEKQDLSNRVLEKENEMIRLRKDMDELRENIQVRILVPILCARACVLIIA